MPDLLQAVSDQSLDAEDPQDRELQQFVTQVSAPALDQFNDVLTLLLANPWMEKASQPLVQEIYTANPDLRYRGATQTEEYETMKRFMSLYTQKLGEHHPQPCSNCKGGLLQKAGRCQFMYEEHATLLPLLEVMRVGADIEARSPHVFASYQQLVSDAKEGNTAPAKRKASQYRKIESEPREDASLESKTPG